MVNDLTGPDHIAEIWRIIDTLGTRAEDPEHPLLEVSSLGLSIAVGPGEPGSWHVSVSHPEQDVALLLHAVGAWGVRRGDSAAHGLVSARSAPSWLRAGYFRRP